MMNYNRIFVVASFFLVAGFWSCTSSKIASDTEYDDLYFNASDRAPKVYTSSLFNQNSSFVSKDANAIQIAEDELLTNESYSAKNVNPEYIAKYSSSTGADLDNVTDEESEYFVEGYNENDSDAGTTINNYYSSPYNQAQYNSWRFSPYYDPYYDPFFNSTFNYNSFYGPSFSINFGYGYGYGFYGWNRYSYWRPYYRYRPSYIYSAFYCPPSGYYYGSNYVNGPSYGPNYGTVVYVNDSYVSVNPDNINRATRKIVRGPRPTRGSTTRLTDNANQDRTALVTVANSQTRRARELSVDRQNQNNYYRRARTSTTQTTQRVDRNYVTARRNTSLNELDRNRSITRTSSNYSRSRINRTSLNNDRVSTNKSGYRSLNTGRTYNNRTYISGNNRSNTNFNRRSNSVIRNNNSRNNRPRVTGGNSYRKSNTVTKSSSGGTRSISKPRGRK